MRYMKLCLILLLCLSLCGCSLLAQGSHVNVRPHAPEAFGNVGQTLSVANYGQLYEAVVQMVHAGTTQQLLAVEKYDKNQLSRDLIRLRDDLCRKDPVSAYALDRVEGTLGTVNGLAALSVQIQYLRDPSLLRQIVRVQDRAGAEKTIGQALAQCESGVLLYIKDFSGMDFTQIVEMYSTEHPELVMEQPQVMVSVYPETGESRLVELKFSYQISRDTLKTMQSQVTPVFRSAALYVSGDAAPEQKYAQLFSFLMERYDYTYATSTTPAYSLLRQGVGDSRAFAMIYGAMCRQAGLECYMVAGNHAGENCYWNIICIDGIYYHVDLLANQENGAFSVCDDTMMQQNGYLWDMPHHRICGVLPYRDGIVGMQENIFLENLKN